MSTWYTSIHARHAKGNCTKHVRFGPRVWSACTLAEDYLEYLSGRQRSRVARWLRMSSVALQSLNRCVCVYTLAVDTSQLFLTVAGTQVVGWTRHENEQLISQSVSHKLTRRKLIVRDTASRVMTSRANASPCAYSSRVTRNTGTRGQEAFAGMERSNATPSL